MPDILIYDGDSISLAKPEIGKAGRPGEKCARISDSTPKRHLHRALQGKISEKDWPHITFIR
ncbi:protein of unknown function [Streptomyces murinus]